MYKTYNELYTKLQIGGGGVYFFHGVLSEPYSDGLCSEECQTKKLVAKKL